MPKQGQLHEKNLSESKSTTKPNKILLLGQGDANLKSSDLTTGGNIGGQAEQFVTSIVVE